MAPQASEIFVVFFMIELQSIIRKLEDCTPFFDLSESYAFTNMKKTVPIYAVDIILAGIKCR